MVQALNYAADAARSLRGYIENGKRKNVNGEFTHDIESLERLLALLEMDVCQHFQLPEGGHIFNDNLKGIQGKPVRLPYPLISISYRCDEPVGLDKQTFDGSKLVHVKKRVIVAIELPREKLADDCFPGCQRLCMVMALFTNGEVWSPCVSVALLPTDKWDGTGYQGDTADAPSFLMEKGGPGFLSKIRIMLPHHFDQVIKRYDRDWAERSIHYDIGGEAAVVLELCEALTCTNVRESVIQRAKPGLNERRIRDGKLPILETRALTLDLPISKRAKLPHQGGTHAIPIGTQLCRGHIRGWPNDPTRNMWIEDYARGTGDVIKKTYQVRA